MGRPCDRPIRKLVNLRAAGLLVSRVLHIRHGVELDIDDVVADLLDPADIDVLHDVAGRRIDGDRSARAFPLHALGRGDQCIAIGLAAGLFQCLVDEMHAVIAANRKEVRVALEFGIEGFHEVGVHLGLVIVVVVPGADAAEREVAEALHGGFVHRLRRCS